MHNLAAAAGVWRRLGQNCLATVQKRRSGMSFYLKQRQRLIAAAGAGAVGLGLWGASGLASGQTLPIAGNPQQAAAQDRETIRGLREQDEAARRTTNELNRDARQEARQGLETRRNPGATSAGAASQSGVS